jgi:hypothetical protein
MKVKINLTVLGAKSFNDTVDGTKYDQTKLIVMIDQKTNDSDRLSNIGFESTDVPFLTSAEYKKNKLADAPYPHIAECEVEITNKGMSALSYKFVRKIELPA